jgi:hypothetical protein
VSGTFQVPPDRREAISARAVKAWEKRRPAWSRNETIRWLNERSAGVLAWLRRRDTGAPARSEAMGRWLQEKRPEVFRRAHTRLASAGGKPGGFPGLTVLEVLT